MDELTLLIVFAVCLNAAGVFLLVRARLFRTRAVRATGRITGLDFIFREDGGGTSRYATVEFVTKDGRRITTKGGDIGNRRLREGSQVEVLYDPRKPAVAYVEGTSMHGGWVGGMLLIFGLCVVLAIVVLRLL